MVDTTAKIICDSVGDHSPRLTTFLLRYPKFVHAEHCRHRSFSLAVSSSRAIPVWKNLEEVRSDELRAGPVFWGAEQKGMSGGEELNGAFECLNGWWNSYCHLKGATVQQAWNEAALVAADIAEAMHDAGVHKSIVNRLLEPFLHVNVLATCTKPGLLNFFGLRLDRAAQPEIRAVVEAMWKEWNESEPHKLTVGDWHLPFIDDETADLITGVCIEAHARGKTVDPHDLSRKVSTARCARLSYTSFETGKRSTIDEDLKLYNRLVGAHPIHASPAEHQATPDVLVCPCSVEPISNPCIDDSECPIHWHYPELSGNLGLGWIQYRKTLAGEAIAPLPAEYNNRII